MSDFNADEMRKVVEGYKESIENDGGFPGVPVNKTGFDLMLNQIESRVRSSAGIGRSSTTISVNSAKTIQEVIAKEGTSEFNSTSFRRTAVAVLHDLIARGFESQLVTPRTMSADFNITFYVKIPRD